jgi:uncharacterized protein YndB with AHSA1/START domain
MNSDPKISEGDNSFGIYHDLTIKAPIENVFRAVSEPEHLINWWPLKCKGNPEMGGIYNFYFAPEYDWYGKVVEYIPKRAFRVKMTKSDVDWDATTFGFGMDKKNGNVQLSFSHLGWPKRNEHFRIASFCWAMLLKGLKDYLEKGVVLPFNERS